MSAENIQIFFEKVKSSPELQDKVREARQTKLQEMADAFSALSAEVSLPFTSEEFLAAAKRSRALTDADLEKVSGGGAKPGCICFA